MASHSAPVSAFSSCANSNSLTLKRIYPRTSCRMFRIVTLGVQMSGLGNTLAENFQRDSIRWGNRRIEAEEHCELFDMTPHQGNLLLDLCS